MAMFKDNQSPFGEYEEFTVNRRNSQGSPQSVFVKFCKPFQGSLLYKSVNLYFQQYVIKYEGRHLRSYFLKKK